MSSSPVLEGVFALHKPKGITSAQALRDCQHQFNTSLTFAPWIAAERARLAEPGHQRWKKKRHQNPQVKLGHGGTLDPLATGVLIVGAGNGTKSLQSFLDCSKTYEAVVLFGAATDSYDSEGKVVARKSAAHVTRALVEEALARFRGDVMQTPPVFSALRVQGKRLYEYAREGKEIPVEIQKRPVRVEEVEVVEWLEPGTHGYAYPAEASAEEKEVVERVLHLSGGGKTEALSAQQEQQSGEPQDLKRKREDGDEAEGAEAASAKKTKQDEPASSSAEDATATTTTTTTTTTPATPPPNPCPAPAARLRMTVSSGFYVRSLCHDLGAAVSSLAFMVDLERSRQGEFEVRRNVLAYDDLAKGEEVWGPKVTEMLGQWNERHPEGVVRSERQMQEQSRKKQRVANGRPAGERKRARNSSSPESG